MIVLVDEALLVECRTLQKPLEHGAVSVLPADFAVDAVQRPAAQVVPYPLDGAEHVFKIHIERCAGNTAEAAYVADADVIRFFVFEQALNRIDNAHPGFILLGHDGHPLPDRMCVLYRLFCRIAIRDCQNNSKTEQNEKIVSVEKRYINDIINYIDPSRAKKDGAK